MGVGWCNDAVADEIPLDGLGQSACNASKWQITGGKTKNHGAYFASFEKLSFLKYFLKEIIFQRVNR